jgi:hypothetical protein
MNTTDFTRNFTSSYFGFKLTDILLERLSSLANLKNLHLDLNPNYIYPATGPKFLAGSQFQINVIVPLIDSKGYERYKVLYPWTENLDEDTNTIKAGVPSSGMLQIGENVSYISRWPIREPTMHGYAPSHYRLDGLSVFHNYKESGDFPVVWRAYNKIKYSWSVAIELIDKGEVLSAVCDRFLALGIMENKVNTQIFYKTKHIGYVRDGHPVLFSEMNSPTISDYVTKVSGLTPSVR